MKKLNQQIMDHSSVPMALVSIHNLTRVDVSHSYASVMKDCREPKNIGSRNYDTGAVTNFLVYSIIFVFGLI